MILLQRGALQDKPAALHCCGWEAYGLGCWSLLREGRGHQESQPHAAPTPEFWLQISLRRTCPPTPSLDPGHSALTEPHEDKEPKPPAQASGSWGCQQPGQYHTCKSRSHTWDT